MKRLANSVCVLVIWVSVSPCVVAQDQKTVNERITHLQNLSPVERDRMDRNIESYRVLSGDQKTQFRKLHEELNRDRLQGGALFNLLEAYGQWLHTLSPAQREQLQSVTETGRKIALVRQFMEDQERLLKEEHDRLMKEDRENSRTNSDAIGQESIPNVRQWNPLKNLQLDKQELDAVMKAIYDDLPADKRPAEFASLSIYQYATIVSESARLKQDLTTWPDPPLLKKMVDKLSQKKVRLINGLTKLGVPEREVAVRLLLAGIMKSAQEAVAKPTEEDRLATIEGLKPADKKTYESLVEERKAGFLNRKFLEKNGDDSNRKAAECRRELYDLFNLLKVEPGPGFVRPSPKRETAVQNKS